MRAVARQIVAALSGSPKVHCAPPLASSDRLICFKPAVSAPGGSHCTVGRYHVCHYHCQPETSSSFVSSVHCRSIAAAATM